MKEEKAHKDEKRESEGEKIRTAAMLAMPTKRKPAASEKESDEEDGGKPPRKNQRHASSTETDITALAQMIKCSNDLKTKEIELHKEELRLNRDKYDLDRAEREARFGLEKSERELQMQMVKQTLELLAKLNK